MPNISTADILSRKPDVSTYIFESHFPTGHFASWRMAGKSICIAACFLTAACAGGTLAGGGSQTPKTKSVSLYGDYLAARHAGNMGEYGLATGYFDKVLTADPQNQGILERTFLLALSDGQIKRAHQLSDDIIKKDKENRLARIVRSFVAVKAGNYQLAQDEIKQASGGAFSQLLNGLLEAWILTGLGRNDEALAAAATLSEHASFDLFRHFHTALINDFNKNPQAADPAYQEALKAGGDGTVQIVQAYGSFLERQGRADEALKLYDKFEDVAKDHPLVLAARKRIAQGKMPPPFIGSVGDGAAEVLYEVASALSQDNGVDVAVIYLRLALYLHEDFDVGQVLLASLFESDERFEDALTAYEKVPVRSPLYKNARIQAAINLTRLERDKEAIAGLKALDRMMPHDIDILTAIADIERSGENYASANDYYKQALDLAGEAKPEHWSLFYSRGITFERLNRWPEAEQDLLKALELSPDNPLVLNYLGYSWIEQHTNLDRAMKMIAQAVELRPNDGYIVDSLGWAHYRLGNFEEAVTQLERAVELKPEDPVINDHLGDAYWKVRRQFEARFQWNKALALKPEEKDIVLIKQKLEQGLEAVQEPIKKAGRE